MYKLDLEKKAENQRSNYQHSLDHRKSKGIPGKKHIFLFHWLCESLGLCGSQQTVEIFKEMGIAGHLTFLLRNLYAQEETVRTRHGTIDWFKIGKGVRQGCILSPCLFNVYAEYIMRNARLEEAQAGIKIATRNINNLDMQMTPPLWQKVKKN